MSSMTSVIKLQQAVRTHLIAVAESYFALAILHSKRDEMGLAQNYATKCLAILSEIGSDHLDDCVTDNVMLEHVYIPELLHPETAKMQFEHNGIELETQDSSTHQNGGA